MKRKCHFCRNQIDWIDYKDVKTLRRYLGVWAKIKPQSESRLCAKHQRYLTKAIKRARYLALLPYTER